MLSTDKCTEITGNLTCLDYLLKATVGLTPK